MKRKIVAVLGVVAVLGLGALAYTQLIKPEQTLDFDRNSAEYKDALARSPKSLGEAPTGTLTPTEFSKSSNKYLNKQVSLHGILLKLAGGKYALVDVGAKNATGLAIYPETAAIQLDKYALDVSKTSKESAANTASVKPVIVTGTLKTDRPTDGKPVTAKFIASSVKQQ